MQTVVTQSEISKLGSSILCTLLYADVFSYPLTREEIYARCSLSSVTMEHLSFELNRLIEEKRLFRLGNFYSVQNNPELATKRQKLNQVAERYMVRARFISRCLGAFPYVRAVFISGSLSKDCMEKDSDIDYFIITHSGRLWISKTCIALIRKLIPLSYSKKYLCTNYFIDQSHLEIEEKNQFTATEIITLIPTYGATEYLTFFRANDWVNIYYPNSCPRSTSHVPSRRKGIIKLVIETLLGGRIGEYIEKYLNIYMSNRHNKFFYQYNFAKEDFAIAIKTKEHIVKLHERHNQKKILKTFDDKIQQYQQQHHVNLTLPHG